MGTERGSGLGAAVLPSLDLRKVIAASHSVLTALPCFTAQPPSAAVVCTGQGP